MLNVSVQTHDLSQHDRRDDLIAGGIAGQIAGLVMAGVMMAVFALFLGKSPLFPVQVIGSFIFGDVAVQGGLHVPSLLAGLALHQLGASLFWGVVFALLAHTLNLRATGALVLAGLGIGVVSQVIDVNLLIPPIFTALHGHDIWTEQVPAFWSWAAHLVFGVTLATFGWVRPKIG
ncbi:MAG: hypothetical protein Q8P18_21235 [Pseudomonadota bacterium]|nr:hypothetical protein [Pseudomonadota bacterium]